MLIEKLNERILILDGGLGTMIQGFQLTEEDYRGTRFASHDVPLKGNNDLLNITRPDVIGSIQRQYLEAGADIFVTNTFNANVISMADYGLQHLVREINLEAGKRSRTLADDFMCKHPERTVFVAGSIGPTNKTASMSPNAHDPAFRSVSYMELYHAYYEQIDALLEGGVDCIIFETAFDTLNMKAGLEAAVQTLHEKECPFPIMLSITLSGKSGRTFSGQTLPAFLTSIQHVPLLSVGLNCSFGASEMKPFLKELANIAPYYISAYPNAGLPNQFGQYDDTPENMAVKMKEIVDEGLVNIIGGCCGTTPAHIAQLKTLVKGAQPHKPAKRTNALWLSGLEQLEVKPENNYISIGERCNVAGSRRFLSLIKEGNNEEALSIARRQVEAGAQVIDINMDDGLLDAVREMTTFLHLIASEPDIARVPMMIDSSKWEVIEQGLMCVQGKSIVNSISLKEGEELFLAHARRIRQLGAAVVVMAFDERGQADTFERKTEVCQRAYQLLTEQVGFPPQDIIFDPNVLAIATGMVEHNCYGLDFIRAVAWIKQHLPHAKVSGGVSNLSFSFRGNNYVREAMHAVFLYHAIQAGMDMGIVNPSSTMMYEDIEPSFRTLLEDVILARRPEAADELIESAQQHTQPNGQNEPKKTMDAWRELPVNERLEYALIKGISDYLKSDMHEAIPLYDKAVQIIDIPLMNGMNRVGGLFGEGKMFLPQVVKTARTMKKAVEILQPYIEREKSTTEASKAGRIVFATVKGDVHDIGKNIVSIVLTCNNYEVIDLGVMVPADEIVETVIREKPDLLCLSGLITPSLDEMIHVTKAMQKAGQKVPILIGGATTSKIHTALKIAPHYDYPVVHATDASQSPLIASRLLNPLIRESYICELNQEYEQLRALWGKKRERLVSLAEARSNKPVIDWTSHTSVVPVQKGVEDMSLPFKNIIPYINWSYFFTAWGLNARYDSLAQFSFQFSTLNAQLSTLHSQWIAQWPEDEQTKAQEAVKLYQDAQVLLRELEIHQVQCRARYGFFEAVSEVDDIILGKERIPTLRQQLVNERNVYHSLSDYVMPVAEGRTDYLGAFVVTVGDGFDSLKEQFEKENDSYYQLLLQTLADRLVEASSEYLHQLVRKDFWGYATDESVSISDLFKGKYQGIRPAVGYPSLPDQSIIFTLDKLLQFDKAGVRLTENGAMTPSATVAGLYFAHPAARYFMIGRISEEQFQDYATRHNEPLEKIRKFAGKQIG